MPKGRTKNKSGNVKLKLPDSTMCNGNKWELSSDESNMDNASIISIASDSRSYYDDAGDFQEVDEQSTKEDLEMQIREAIDGCTQKSAKGREVCLNTVCKAVCTNSLFDFVSQRKLTICDSIERSLKKGKGTVQASAAKLASALAITLGSYEQDVATLNETLNPILTVILNDYSMSYKARCECASALGITTFVESSDMQTLCETMENLQNIFSGSFLKGNGNVQNLSQEFTTLHTAALTSWCLILTLLPYSKVFNMMKNSISRRIPELLLSSDVELRIAAGEAIALIHEMARNYDEDFEMDNPDELCETLKKLATDSNKYRAKKDRRQQRSSFRDVLATVDVDDYPYIQIKFGQENLDIYSWCKKRQYDSFCAVLGTGVNLHLAENEMLRDIFELGPPIDPSCTKVSKVSKFERHMLNVAAFKARTKARSKNRDKRSAVVN